jgi:putative copper resistance protein D
MPFLLVALRRSDPDTALRMARRYSVLAMVSVPTLIGAGLGLSYFYIGSWPGLYGTSYGVLVMAKAYLLLAMLVLGASNQRLLSTGNSGLLTRLSRFSEAEIGLGLTALLAAASLTSQPPAIDLGPPDRLTAHQIVERLRWEAPRLSSPPLSALAPPNSLAAALPAQQFGDGTVNDSNDRAWSEYNHHWAGLIVLAAALLALVYRTAPPGRLRALGQNWPLLFIALAVFILLRADPENWPLGPRPFWASFSRPDVLEHRLYALLITAFACFEWAVEKRRIRSPRAAWFFPLACAAGGAVLLTHAHALGSPHDEMLSELSHTLIALLGATAGWGRWLELRLPGSREARWAGRLWPVCLLLAGLVLLDYRES